MTRVLGTGPNGFRTDGVRSAWLGRTIVVLESSVIIRDTLELMLRDTGANTFSYENADELTKEISSVAPDLFILSVSDLNRVMGVFPEELKTRFPSARIVLLADISDGTQLDSVQAHGVDDVYPKPFDFARLLKSLDRLLTTGPDPVEGPGGASVGGLIHVFFVAFPLWITYSVLPFLLSIPFYAVLDHLWPEASVSGPAPTEAILVRQAAGFTLLPGLVLYMLRRRGRYLFSALFIPIAATLATMLLLSCTAPDTRNEIWHVATHALPYIWLGALCAMAYAYDQVGRKTKKKV